MYFRSPSRFRFVGLGIGALVSFLVFACSSSDPVTPGADAATAQDAQASVPDATITADGSVEKDAGTTPTNPGVVEILRVAPNLTGSPLGMARNGMVIMAVGATSLDDLYFWKAGVSTKVTMPADIALSVNGINATACGTSNGHIGFNGKKNGSNIVAFFDGTTVVDTGITAGMILAHCSDGDKVIGGSAGSGTGDFLWSPGNAPSAIAGSKIGNKAVKINSAGTILLNGGINKGGVYTAFPAGLNMTPLAMNDNEFIVGMVVDGGLFPALLPMGAAAPTKLPAPPGLAAGAGASAVDVNNNGEVLVTSSNRWWVYSTTTNTYKEGLATGYTVGRGVAINDAGQVLAVGQRADKSGDVAMLLVKP